MSDLFIPDRFEAIKRKVRLEEIYKHFICEVKPAIKEIDDVYSDMCIAGRGSFLILYGKSGIGKTTFIYTLPIFKQNVEVVAIENDESIELIIKQLDVTSADLRIVMIEGREAVKDSSIEEIEKSLHSINKFIRSDNGEKTLVVWLCNKEKMRDTLINLAKDIGGEALLGLGEGVLNFTGPSKKDFTMIAKNTIRTLNEGATLLSLGITEEQSEKIIKDVETIGRYLGELRQISKCNNKFIKKLVGNERCKMWVVVIAGNDPRKDVASLTGGSYAIADLERMLVATDANIVEAIKEHPSAIGKLAAFFDCKILYLPILTVMSVIRDFADDDLIAEMKKHALMTTKGKKGLGNFRRSDLAKAILGDPIGMGKQGAPVGPNSISAFEKISSIASNNDRLLNKTIAKALVKAELIEEYELESDFGNGLTRRTDILCETDEIPLRLELMWRKKLANQKSQIIL